MAPIISALIRDNVVEPRAYPQAKCFEAAVQFARSEGIIPAPETSHAIAAAIDEARGVGSPTGGLCPECGTSLVFEEGCGGGKCRGCGYANC
jgi:hypothetical protein